MRSGKSYGFPLLCFAFSGWFRDTFKVFCPTTSRKDRETWGTRQENENGGQTPRLSWSKGGQTASLRSPRGDDFVIPPVSSAGTSSRILARARLTPSWVARVKQAGRAGQRGSLGAMLRHSDDAGCVVRSHGRHMEKRWPITDCDLSGKSW